MSDSPTKRAVLELKKQEGNGVCADCSKPGKFNISLYDSRGSYALVPEFLSMFVP